MDNNTSIALSRLMAQQRAMDVTATNIANASTPGYRAARMLFSDWLLKQQGIGQPAGGTTQTYTQDRATYRDTQPGPVSQTGNPLDIAIGTAGYFTVQTARGPRLSRAGHFELSSTGAIVDGDGNALLDTAGQPLQIAPADSALSIAGDGTISSQNGRIGRIGIVTPADAQQMQAEGSRLFNATATTTAPVAAPKLTQGALEGSDVQPTLELTRMMSDSREFQFVSQYIQEESDRQQSAIDKITNRNG
jgi:flagellar basal-body rod protein FlgF